MLIRICYDCSRTSWAASHGRQVHSSMLNNLSLDVMRNGVFSDMRLKVSQIRRAVPTIVRRLLNRSDVRRWANSAALSSDWDSRTRLLAGLISPGSSVLEFGAGRQALKAMLADGCTYTPSD